MAGFQKALRSSIAGLTALVLLAMMVHLILHALSRYFFDFPFYGTNEIVMYWYLPFVALLGIPIAQMQGEQITVTVLTDNISWKSSQILRIFAGISGFVVSLLFAWFGLLKAMENTSLGMTAGVTDIITWPAYYVVPVVFVLLAPLYATEIINNARREEPSHGSISA